MRYSARQKKISKTRARACRCPPPHGERIAASVVCISLVAIVWVTFGHTLHGEFLNYDDNRYVYDNPTVASGLSLAGIQWAFTHVHADNWHSLTTISHMLDCQLYGLQPWGHHLTNDLLHALAAVLLFLAVWKLTGSLWPSAFVAVLFAVHPLRVESVGWISERKDVLSGVFFALTLLAYARYARSEQRSVGRYTLVVILFALGLMCKPTVVTLPFVLLLLDYWPLGRITPTTQNRFARWRYLISEKAPLFALSAMSCVATVLAQREALGASLKLPAAERLGNAVMSYVVYLRQTIYPARLAILYPYSHPKILAVIPALLLLISISAVFFYWRGKYPFLLVGWLWFLGMLVPMSGLIQLGSQAHADRYTYLPQIGLDILATLGGIKLLTKWRGGRELSVAAALLIMITMIALSRKQTSYWQNSETLWRHTAEVTSNNHTAHNSLANALLAQGRLDEAVAEYRKAVEIKPDVASVQSNLGNALGAEGKFSEAIEACEAALRIRPDYAEAHNNLGCALASIGRTEEAIKQFSEALRINGDYVEAHYNLGRVLAQIGRREEAVAHLTDVLRFKPDYLDTKQQLHELGVAVP